MSLYILDTDHVSLFQRNHKHVTPRVISTNPSKIAVTIVTVEEQLRGWFKEIRRATDSGQVWAYSRMRMAFDYFQTIEVLDFDDAAYEHFVRLRQQKIRIGTQDLRIAAITLSVHGTLVSRNHRDFSQIPDLVLEDWSS